MQVMEYSKPGQKPVQIGVGPVRVVPVGQSHVVVSKNNKSICRCDHAEQAQWLCGLINKAYNTDNAQHFKNPPRQYSGNYQSVQAKREVTYDNHDIDRTMSGETVEQIQGFEEIPVKNGILM